MDILFFAISPGKSRSLIRSFKMHKIIYIFLFLYFITAEAHFKFPVAVEKKSNSLTVKTEPKINYTLPNTVIPKHYNLTLIPDLDEKSEKSFTFVGIVEIEVQIKTSIQNITLHSRNLTYDVNNITITRDGDEISSLELHIDEHKDFNDLVHISKKGNFTGDSIYKLKINYTGILNDEMRGFYRSSYINENGKRIWLGATHFEPVGARRAFPCFDEPAYKATFDVTIIHGKNYTAISNAVHKASVDFNGKIKTTFETTPKMSTYLLAFVVSDFKNITNKAGNFSVYARSNAIQNGKLALEVGEKLLKALENFTGIPFEMKKMDQAAIPDFAAGAMENWGLVTYREKSLLYDEKLSTTSEKQNIVETIAHEFAHQWFGDLVSPKWWKFLWLNEGFATFFQSYITEKVDPDWSSIYQSVVKSIQTTAFSFDSSSSTHPINQDVESPNEISAIFDSISYQKGGAVIRMMQHFLTEPIFQEGLQEYLKANHHKAANSSNFFEVIGKVVQKNKLNLEADLDKLMDTWFNKKGYPVITVTRNYTHNKIKIKQERFFAYNASKEELNDKYNWYVPINNATEANPNFTTTTPDRWLKDSSMNVTIKLNPNHWLILNKQQTGFYRVNYDEQNWRLLIDYLKSSNREKIHVLNRAQLVNDALAFAQKGQFNLQILLNLTAYLKNETDYIAWYPGYKTLSWLHTKLINTEHYSAFRKYVLNITHELVKTVGLEQTEKDKYVTKLNRIAAVNLACTLGDSACSNRTNEKLTAWLDDPQKNIISPDLQQVTICNGLRTANMSVWNKTLEAYNKTTNDDEKKRIFIALGCSNSAEILQYYLNYTVTNNPIINDTFGVIRNILGNNVHGVDVVLDFTINRFITLYRRVKADQPMVDLFRDISQKITTPEQLQKLKESELKDISIEITNKAIEVAEENLKWLRDNENVITNWIKEITKHIEPSKPSGVGISSGSLGLITSLLLIIFVSNQ